MKIALNTTRRLAPFSILERIDVGETQISLAYPPAALAFSILERIDVGETYREIEIGQEEARAFSILERIDVGETSNATGDVWSASYFQYPRTDRRG